MPTLDKEKILESFANSPILFDAVHTFIKEAFESDASMNSSMPNELLGQKTRARLEGIATVEDAFRKLRNYKSLKTNNPDKNPAR